MARTDQDLERLFRAYRAACPDPDAGPNFMPGVWQKIEARRTFSRTLRRWTGAFVTAAAAVCVAMAVFTGTSVRADERAILGTTYIEALEGSGFETLAYEELLAVSTYSPASQGIQGIE